MQGAYALVRGSSNALNLLKPHDCGDGQVCRVLSGEVGVVRPYQTLPGSKVYVQGAYALDQGS